MTPLTTPLPNPNTPLAFFTPIAAYQASIAVYAHVGAVSVMIWDMLDNVPEDYKLLVENKISIATLTYFLSRAGSLGYALSGVIFQTTPTGNCDHFETIVNSFYPVALSFTGLLFFIRLRAIYNRNPIIVGLFFILWVGLLGCTMVLPIQAHGKNIGTTNYCIDAAVPNSVYVSIFAPFIHDTLVFAAISYCLVQNCHMDMTFREGFKVALFGNYLPRFTKSLLLDGQKYYLISLISNLVFVVMVYDTNLPIALRSMGAATNIVITNIMACRVYRRTRFGQFREDEISTTKMQENFADQGLPSFPVFAHTNDARLGQNSTSTFGSGMNVTSNPKSKPYDDRVVVIGHFEHWQASDTESNNVV